ncbi:alpha/beta fold hydrolase [Rhizorhabdus dicambivorans]|uniref:Alpha/beta hydrolase n=1 Tax=Rhizorhabdus dicambivorans TaxID=1850238 RepID=A0A2A4FV71_9SPHN|nr:alpha/beta hydrolase [Rhizorhabdus dicambivorans]ATE64711.1 alpha/beta hydrolase [Rhizorhabdus dicambivorans]PCE41348.1 alpha/beta hydrolase [Rhizorhabdus dicambivorans]
MSLCIPNIYSFVSQRLMMSYNDYGNADAPALLLVHGGRDHGRSWDWVASDLVKDWHVVAPDLRGHGNSSWSADGNYDLTDFTCDLAQLVYQLGQKPVRIIAHSVGGQVAVRYASLFPEMVERLIIIEGTFQMPRLSGSEMPSEFVPELRLWIERKREASEWRPRHYATFEEAVARMKKANPNLSDDQAGHLTLFGVNRNEDGSFSWKFDSHLWISSPIDGFVMLGQDLWKEIRCPILLCHGRDSWIASPTDDESMGFFVRPPAIAMFENAGHWLHHDRLERFLSHARSFLA